MSENDVCPKCGGPANPTSLGYLHKLDCPDTQPQVLATVYKTPEPEVENLRRQLSAAQQRVGELEKIVSQLPKTADGVPQIPMLSCPWLVEFYPRPHVQNAFRWQQFFDAPEGVWHVTGDINDNPHWTPVSCAYSTREAGQAHIEAALAAKESK